MLSITAILRDVSTADLHPDTAPEAIAEAQREAVAEAVCALSAGSVAPSVEAVSRHAVLPPDVVKRRLAEIRGDAPEPKTPRDFSPVLAERVARIVEYIRRHGPSTVETLARALSLNYSQVQRLVSPTLGSGQRPAGGVLFRKSGKHKVNPRRGGAARILWDVREKVA